MSKVFYVTSNFARRVTYTYSGMRSGLVQIRRLIYRYDCKYSTSTTTENTNISSLVSRVMKQTSQIDIMVTTIPQSTIAKQVEALVILDASPDEIVDLFVKKPILIQSKSFASLVNVLKSYGVEKKMVLRLISENDNFHDTKPDKVTECFGSLRKIGLSNVDILNLFGKNQDILSVSSKYLHTRFNDLKELFSSEHSLRLLKTMPLIITESLEDIKEKFMYVHYSMGISQNHMISASLFQHPLKHVKNRHVFLQRMGLFHKPKKDNTEFKSINPSLKDIIDTSDTKFVQLFSKTMTVEDYWTFCKLLETETVNKEKSIDSDDSDII